MQIDPKVSYWINVVIGIMTATSLGVFSLTDFVSPALAHEIMSGAAGGVVVLNIVLHGYSSPAQGPGMPPVLKAPEAPDWKPPGVPDPRR